MVKVLLKGVKTNKRNSCLRNCMKWGFILLVLLAIFLMYIFYNPTPSAPLSTSPYKDANLPIEERVADLLSQMTLTEKIGQMALVEKNSVFEIGDIATYGLGALLSGSGAKPEENTLMGWRKMTEGYLASSRSSRLGIPILYGSDAIHGHAHVPGATVFPHAIALGATGDADLVKQVAEATARELQATGVNWNYAPNLDLPTDIRWGRVYETFSDDPKLASELGNAYVEGLQSVKNGEGTAVMSTLKHYVGLGGMLWDTSSNENFKIDQGYTKPDEARLRAEYLPPFQAGVEAGAMSVMVGLNSWGDKKLASSKYLITDVLKSELGFSGIVVSDWYGVYEIPGGDFIASIKGINAGVDMVMLPFDYKTFMRNVRIAVRLGLISESRIDDAVTRILTAKFTLGLFDEIAVASSSSAVMSTREHKVLAEEVVAKSLVLLKNEGVLPISSTVRHIRVAGSSADNVGRQAGAWTVEWQGVDGNWLQNSSSIFAGIKARAPLGVMVEYNKEGIFATPEKKADIGIAVVGEAPYAEGWGDNELPIISESDRQVILNLQEVSSKVIVVIVSGRPLFIDHEVADWDGLVMAWLPGVFGGAIAPVLFGDEPFVGKLPLPWPKTLEQIPIGVDGTTSDGTKVLFPRYFGL